MIHLFNRRQLLTTTSMELQAKIRERLSANQIEYHFRTTNLESPALLGVGRAHTGSIGIRQNETYEYRIYVNKADYEKALHLLD